jgi:high affinity sulfate transporter 1
MAPNEVGLAPKGTSRPNLLTRYIPILGWLPKYQREWIRLDLIAGLTIVALLVPEGMAYAELAGLAPEAIFYAAPPALLLYAIFGTSRQLVVAVSSTVAITSAATVTELAPASALEYVALSAALAMLAGLFSIVAGFLRGGIIAQFFSGSVLTGFVFGLAMVIIVKQLPKLFGLEAAEGDFFERLWDLIINLPETHLPTLIVGATSLILMIFLEKRFPRVPSALAALVYGIALGTIFGSEDQGVHVVGQVKGGLVGVALPDLTLNHIALLISGALGIALLAFAEASGPARRFAGKHSYKIDANQELIGIGAANFGAGLFQGFPIGSSLSISAANDNAGAKSNVALIVAAILTILVALFLTPVFQNLPEATLAAIVIVAIWGMMNVFEMKRLYRLNRTDFWLALVALLAVLFFEVLVGLAIAVVTSLLVLIFRASKPKLSLLGRTPGGMGFGDVGRHPDYQLIPGLLVMRPNEGLFFANATALQAEIGNIVRNSEPPAQTVLLDLEMTYELDVPSTDMLIELSEECKQLNVDLMLARVHGEVRDAMDLSGVTEKIGAENIYTYVFDGLLAYLEDKEAATDRETEALIAALNSAIKVIDKALERADGAKKIRLEATRRHLEMGVAELESGESSEPN